MPRVKLFDEQEVLEKAMHLFWKRGYASTSFNDLVSNLGISRASIYDTYGDKEALFKKSLAHYRKINTEAIAKLFETSPNVIEGFQKLFTLAIEDAVKDKDLKGCFVVNTTTELIPNDLNFLQIIQENKTAIEQLFFDYLTLGKEQNQLTTTQDLKALASFLFVTYNGIRVVSKVNPNLEELQASVDLALGLLA